MPPPIIPPGINAAITFFEAHLNDWAANQGTIGITVQQVADIATQTIAARAALTAAEQARVDARTATITLHTAVDAMRNTGSGVVKTVRAFAESTDNNAVYGLAGLPLPQPSAPLPPAPTPTNFSGLLNSDGHVELEWSSEIEGRIFFAIERQVTPVGGIPGGWENRGAVPAKKFTDTTVPPGANSVNYRVAARRGTSQSIFTDPVIVLLATPGTAVA